MNATSSASIDRRPQRTRRIALIATIVALGIGGCGGGGSAGGGGGSTIGTVSITVTDVFGDPVADAAVSVSHQRSPDNATPSTTNATGKVTMTNVTAGQGTASAQVDDFSAGYQYGYVDYTLAPNGRAEVELKVRPAGFVDPFAIASVASGGISGDRRSLEFAVQVFRFEYYGEKITRRDCVPKTENDTPDHQADCVQGPAGFDAPYVAAPNAAVLPFPDALPGPLAVAVLLDQSSNSIVSDPSDMRLFALKYFLTTLENDSRVVLAAFASDAAASGPRSLLAQAPVTIFPVGNPQFAPFDRGLFATVDSLPMLEGGAAPLYASIDRMLDFTGNNAAPGGRRAVVVFSNGLDDTCGSAIECQNARRALIDKSRALGVEIFAVGICSPDRNCGVRSPSELADRASLNELARSSGGAVIWADKPGELGFAFGLLSDVLHDRAPKVQARFVIESPTDRAFESGHTLLGTVWLPACDELGGGCGKYDIPFAVRIP